MTTYPPTRSSEQVDDYHGTRVADPFRWLEDVDAPETQAWIKAQNAVTFEYLAVRAHDIVDILSRERLTTS